MDFNSELAEVCGIHAGDGYLRNDGHRRELDISGNVEEKEYYDTHVKPLFEKVFNIEIKNRFFPHRNTYGFVIRNKEVIEFMHNLGFPYGKKTLIVKVPKWILENKDEETHKKFLRGLFDTDGSLNFIKKTGNYKEFKKTHNYYPTLCIVTTSNQLYKDTQKLLKEIGIEYYYYYNVPKKKNENPKNVMVMNGTSRMLKWINLIGIKNSAKLSRYEIWKKFGFCPSNITYEQRIKILNGEINPYNIRGP